MVAVKACHASSKTRTAALAVLWWILSRPDGIALTTAPSWTQVQEVLWAEIRRLIPESKIAFPDPNLADLHIRPNNFAMGISTDRGVRFQGFHGSVLVVIDEAPGVKAEIWEAIQGIRAGGDVRVLALGNPTIASGPFYDAFTSGRKSWRTFTLDAFDTPNLRGIDPGTLREMGLGDPRLDDNTRPYLVTRRWVRERLDEWGEDSPLWEARVRGSFPTQAENALVALSWIEAARLRPKPPGGVGRTLVVGIDVAGPGEDETAVAIRDGSALVDLRAWRDPDPLGSVLAFLLSYKSRIAEIRYDSVGIGYYFGKRLEDAGFARGSDISVVGVNVGEAPRDGERFRLLKDEIHWAFRDRAKAGDLSGVFDETLVAQLVGIRYRHDSRGRVVVESKDEIRKRGGKSPDRAEAVLLAFCEPKRISSSRLVTRPPGW